MGRSFFISTSEVAQNSTAAELLLVEFMKQHKFS